MRQRCRSLVPLLLAAGAVQAGPEVVVTRHYDLRAEAPREEAEGLGVLLEAAYVRFQEFFGAEPAGTQPLVVRFFGTREAWAAALASDRAPVPAAAGGYYHPSTKTAYLYRQPTTYFTRVLLLHEAAHQFHFLARTQNESPSAAWYTEGLAEHLSWHLWDGERLTLGVTAPISLEDYPARAREQPIDLAAIVQGKAEPPRPVCWALFHYLATAADGKAFDRFRDKVDRGTTAASVFGTILGPPGQIQKRFDAWLSAQEQPWTPVFNEWEPTGPSSLRGRAGVVSACRLKVPVGELEASFELPSSGRAGLLLHYTSTEDYTTALLTSAGTLQVARRAGGDWQILAEEPVAFGGKARALREGARIKVQLGEAVFGPWELPGETLGLALDSADVSFRDIRYR